MLNAKEALNFSTELHSLSIFDFLDSYIENSAKAGGDYIIASSKGIDAVVVTLYYSDLGYKVTCDNNFIKISWN